MQAAGLTSRQRGASAARLVFHESQDFAPRLGYGHFDDAHAPDAVVAGVVARRFDGLSTGSITVDAGIGVGAEADVRLGNHQ